MLNHQVDTKELITTIESRHTEFISFKKFRNRSKTSQLNINDDDDDDELYVAVVQWLLIKWKGVLR